MDAARSLLSLAPTLLELCGLPPRDVHDGPSLVPLLADPETAWPHVALTHLSQPGSFGLSAERGRYIRYMGGGEERYDVETDPYELQNLAQQKDHKSTLERLHRMAPKNFSSPGIFLEFA